MSRFGTSWAIVRYAFHIMRRHPRLLGFPVISLVVFGPIVLMMAPWFLDVTALQMWQSLWSEEAREVVKAAFLAATDPDHAPPHNVLTAGYIPYILISTFLMTFINVAFYSQIIEAMSGGRCLVLKGFSQASAKLTAIVAWTIVAGTVSILLDAAQESSAWLGGAFGLAGMCWTAVSFFVIPVMLNEPRSRTPLEYLKISMSLLKRVWAEALIGIGAMALVTLALMVAIAFISVAFTWDAVRVGDAPPRAYLLVASTVIFVLLYVALQIFECGLYVYATQGVAPGKFDPDSFERAWMVRDSSRGPVNVESGVSQPVRVRKPWSAGMRRAVLGLVAVLAVALGLLWRDTMGPPRIVDDVAATEVPRGLPKLRPPDFSGSTPAQDEMVTRAVSKQYPRLDEVAEFEATTIVDIALREDGSVYCSRVLWVTPDDRRAMMSDPSEILPQQPGARSGIVFRKKEAAGGQRFRHDLWIRYVILTEEPDSSRDVDAVRGAVLATHSDLLMPVVSEQVNRVTVFLSEDGKVVRHFVETYNVSDARPSGDQVPEDVGRYWEALGLRLDQLGPMGITQILAQVPGGTGPEWKNQGRMVVRYAWARRPDEPIGGVPLAQRRPRILPFTHADVATVVDHFLPGALNDKGETRSGTPWLVLSQKGDVVRSGYVKARPDQKVDAGLFDAKHPEEQIGMILETLVVRRWRESFSNRVIVAWLKPADEIRGLASASP